VLYDGAHWRNLTNMTERSMSVGPAKTAELIAMPFGMWTQVGPRNHALDWVHIAPSEGTIFRGTDMLGHA